MSHTPQMAKALTTRAAVTGQRFTFTEAETNMLHNLAASVREGCTFQRGGWRVRVVRDVTEMHRLIAAALARAETPEPNPTQIPLPLG